MVDDEAKLKDLMLRGLDGDAVAWCCLLQSLRSALSAYYRPRLIGREAEAEDLVQDCLIAVHAKRATYDRTLPFTAWAYAIARYKLIDHFRRTGRHPHVSLDEAKALSARHTVEDGVVRKDLDRLLGILPARQRRLIEDVRLGGYSLAEAAARHGFTEGAAKVSVHRSMKALANSVIRHEN